MTITETGKSILLNHDSGTSAEIQYVPLQLRAAQHRIIAATHLSTCDASSAIDHQLTSWKNGGKERFFVSSTSTMDSTKPIRGGIPIVFPIFGPPPSSPPEYAALSQHGFARTQVWKLEHVIMDRKEGVSIRLAAPAPPNSFPHNYTLTYVVTLTAHQLSTDVHITNNGDKDFIFQALLHTYLAVPDASKISITGLDKGVAYFDKAGGRQMKQWSGGALTIDKETDAVFHSLPSPELKLEDGTGSVLIVRFRGFEDCTIWNPQEAAGSKMADMEAGGWERYVCIEPGYVREFKTLKPGEEFLGQQILSVQ
ncbi:MAG: hypothetical protein TREMPRED_000351 [Tremellales sp. Tagirdzhanova-0007]|nr:MAG: hypothetical protein TREMPRED_000351 [Tremellales sp. Tagirdzhanova-0007]